MDGGGGAPQASPTLWPVGYYSHEGPVAVVAHRLSHVHAVCIWDTSFFSVILSMLAIKLFRENLPQSRQMLYIHANNIMITSSYKSPWPLTRDVDDLVLAVSARNESFEQHGLLGEACSLPQDDTDHARNLESCNFYLTFFHIFVCPAVSLPPSRSKISSSYPPVETIRVIVFKCLHVVYLKYSHFVNAVTMM